MSDTSISVRPMMADDLAAVVAVERLASSDPWSQELFVQEFNAPQRNWLVAEDGSGVVGFCGVMMVTDEAHIMNIAVDPDHRRRGVGGTLIAAVLKTSIDAGATAATLEVRASNSAAIALYRRFGFTEEGRRPQYYRDGDDGLIMWNHNLTAVGIRASDQAGDKTITDAIS